MAQNGLELVTKRLARLISRQHCHVGNTAQHCRLDLFQDSDFAGDLKDSESTSEGISCIFGSRTFLKLFLWMLVCAWMEFPPLIPRIW